MTQVPNDNEANDTTTDSRKEQSGTELKLDKHGLPLVPQPSDYKDDPLVQISRARGYSY